MTITVLPARNEYTATASQTVFNYTFKIFENTDLNVYITPAGQEADDSTDLTTAYTVDAGTIGNEDGGFITMDSGVTSGYLVTIVSDVPESRTTDYQFNGDFIPDTVNDDIDRTVQLVKQVEDTASRTLTFQQSLQNASALILPNPAATFFMRWRADELGLENVDLTSLGTPTDASVITYNPPFANSVSTDVETQLSESVVLISNFGAFGGGVIDETTEITNALTSGKTVVFTPGTYIFKPASTVTMTSTIVYQGDVTIETSGMAATIAIDGIFNDTKIIDGVSGGLTVLGSDKADGKTFLQFEGRDNEINGVAAQRFERVFYVFGDTVKSFFNTFRSCQINNCLIGVSLDDAAGGSNVVNGTIFDNFRFSGAATTTTELTGVRIAGDSDRTVFINPHFEDFVDTGTITSAGIRMVGDGASNRALAVLSATTESVNWMVYAPAAVGMRLVVEGFMSDASSDLDNTIELEATASFAVNGFVRRGVPSTENWVSKVFTDQIGPQDGTSRVRFTMGKSNDSAVFDLFEGTTDYGIRAKSSGNGFDIVADPDGSNDIALTIQEGSSVRPGSDNTTNLGTGSSRWAEVFAANATINTSDQRLKEQERALNGQERAVAVKLKAAIRMFKFKDSVAEKGDDARLHCGVMAQEVVSIFNSEGLNASHYSLLCFDKWDAEYDNEGVEIRAAGDRYGIRYEQLLAFIIGTI